MKFINRKNRARFFQNLEKHDIRKDLSQRCRCAESGMFRLHEGLFSYHFTLKQRPLLWLSF